MDKQKLLETIFRKPWPQNMSLPEDLVVEQILITLRPREKFVLERRFADKPMTLKQVGEICPRGDGNPLIGVCGERVRQIEEKALRKCRHRTRRKVLFPD